MPTEWSVEGELLSLTNTDNLDEALASAAILPSNPGEKVQLHVDQDWWRSGAETYALVFTAARGELRRKAIMKSCVTWGPQSVTATFAQWLRRRLLLLNVGVEVPKLYCHDGATLVEEFIEYEFFPLASSAESRSSLLYAAGRAAGLISREGFLPLSLLDWRSRGSDVVVVDFGEDLGGPGPRTPESALATLSELVHNFDRGGANLHGEELKIVERGFASALG